MWGILVQVLGSKLYRLLETKNKEKIFSEHQHLPQLNLKQTFTHVNKLLYLNIQYYIVNILETLLVKYFISNVCLVHNTNIKQYYFHSSYVCDNNLIKTQVHTKCKGHTY